MNTKVGVLIIIALLVYVSINFVHAQENFDDEVVEAGKSFVDGTGEFFSSVLSPLIGNKELLTRVFFFALLYMILYSLISTFFKGKKLYSHGITFIITALAILGLPPNFITAIRTQYGAMGAAMLSVIPFVIMLVFTVKLKRLMIGRLLWIFFSVYYVALYLYQVFSAESGWLSVETIPYLIAVIAGILVFVFLQPLRNAIFKGEMGEIEEEASKTVQRAKALHRLQKRELEGYKGG